MEHHTIIFYIFTAVVKTLVVQTIIGQIARNQLVATTLFDWPTSDSYASHTCS
jgi:hypothetical protein